MTRDEAMLIARDEATLVDRLVALGLLKLDEPEDPIDELEKHLISECGWLFASIVVLRKAMHHTGLKVVRA
jgi:hypothetical protein